MTTTLIRADSSSYIGTGHIMRDLVLAKRDFSDSKVLFAVRDLPGNINHKIEKAGYKKAILQSDSIDELISLVRSTQADVLVIDHYDIGYEDEKYIKEKTGVTLFILDDTYERHHCDILLNNNVYADPKRYKGLVPSGCELRCAKEHMLIRDEFHEALEQKERGTICLKPEGQTHVFVAMGGADTLCLNIPILETLASYENLHAHVVTTRANRNLKTLEDYAARQKHVSLYVETERVAELIAGSDFAIVTPSVTMNEVIFMKLAFIAIQTANNQKEMVSYLQNHSMLCLKVFDPAKLTQYTEELLDSMSAETFNFIDLNMEEKEKILQWRNHPEVRKWMYHDSPIELNEHLHFIDTLKDRTDQIYFLVKVKGTPIGVIDFTEIDNNEKSAHFGIYADPSLRGKGGILIRILTTHAFSRLKLQKLIGEVFCDNKKAIELYRRFGFQEIDNIKKNGRQLTIMELKYENWKL